MPNEKNQDKNDKMSGGSSGAAAGMQVSGEEIFLPEDKQPKVTKESDVFGQQPASGQPKPSTGGQPAQSAQKPANPGEDETAKEVSKQVGQVLSGDTKPITDALNQAKDAAGQAYEVAGNVAGKAYETVQDKAGSVITEQKQSLADGLSSVAENIRQFGDNLRGGGDQQPNPIISTAAKYGETLAEQVENLSDYFESGDFRTFARDLQSFARRNPTVFVATAFGLGLIAARFIKSNPRSAASNGRNRAPRLRQVKSTASLNNASDAPDDRASARTSPPPTV